VRQRWPYAIAVVAALTVAGVYLARELAVGPALGFPLDDAYIYMTYAKQIARFHPFTYFDGGGYSAGATSMLWPLVLAPMWALGLRGALLGWGVFVLCAALLATSACLAVAISRRVLGEARGAATGVLAAVLVVTSGTASWGYLSGMEVPLAATLVLATSLRMLDEGAARPSTLLLVLLAATSVARPELGLLVAGVVVARAALRPREALRWLAPLAAPLAVAATNQLLIGHAAPNTAIVKSQIYLPGFEWGAWIATAKHELHKLLEGLFWSGLGGLEPLWLPRLTLLAWLVGAARLFVWAARARRLAGALVLILAPAAVFLVVIVVSGLWRFQNYRYLAPILPAILVVCALGLALPARLPTAATVAGALALAVAAAVGDRAFLDRDLRIYAQGARDNNAQVVRIGRWIDANLPPDALVALHDVGAVGYYSNRRLLDVIGLITNGQAEVCNQGPGARFEAFERMPPAERPAYFAYYPGWLLTGSRDLFGPTLFAAAVPPPLGGPRLVGGEVMEVLPARWDLLGSGAAPLDAGGQRVADEVDVADLASEREHGYRADLGARKIDTPTATWSQYLSAADAGKTVADGGRTIHVGGERFALRVDAAKPVRLVVRTGGPAQMAYSTVPAAPRSLVVRSGGAELGRIALPAPSAGFAEASLDLPAGPARLELTVTAADGKPYRAFHWFALQP